MKKNTKTYNEIYGGISGKTMNLGLMIGVSIALCTFVGYEIDTYFNCSPKGIVSGSIFGIISGFVNMWEQLKKMNKDLDKKNGKSKEELPKN